MIPRYGEWLEKWRDKGLSVVGVHTPEMDYERDAARLREFVRTNKIAWPVVLDPDYAAWRRYQVEAWPTIVLIDRAGVVRKTVIGDNQSAEIEASLKKLLGI
jgi:hypothetical protein